MVYTNNLNLPDTLYKALSNDPYKKEGNFSATELSQPRQIWALRRRYKDQIEVDVSDLLYPLLGNNVHYIFERSGVKDALIEERFISEKLGLWTISGAPDLYKDKILWDYKVTTMWVLTSGIKPEWESQLNIYAWLLRQQGFAVDAMKVCCIFRDWSKIQAIKNPNYASKKQVAVLPVGNMWPDEQVEKFCLDKIAGLLATYDLPDSHLPECTPDEIWRRPTKYAVMKKGNKRATKLFDVKEIAMDCAIEKGKDYRVEKRPGENTRCEFYCELGRPSGICKQYTKIKTQEG